MTLEAMKMEIEIRIPGSLDGAVVERILAVPGTVVQSGQPLVILRRR